MIVPTEDGGIEDTNAECAKAWRAKAQELEAKVVALEGALEGALHTPCPSCCTPTEPDIRVCPKCLDAWIGGKGCEFLDKEQAPLRSRVEALTKALEQLRPGKIVYSTNRDVDTAMTIINCALLAEKKA